MPTHQSSHFLDVKDDNNEVSAEDDNIDMRDSRTAGFVSKRQKLSHSDSENNSDGGDELITPHDRASSKSQSSPISHQLKIDGSTEHEPSSSSSHTKSTKKQPSKPGVIYLSRIPPYMAPAKVRSLLAVHGPISRVFLTPEPPSVYLARKNSHKGNKKRSYVDGWVEFGHKRHAKACVDAINGNIIGGKKGGWYRDDVWNARYLRGFGWDDLMAGVRGEEREREERVRVGLAREARERGAYLKNVERARVQETREDKKKRKRSMNNTQEDLPDGCVVNNDKRNISPKAHQRRFRQNEVKNRRKQGLQQPDEVNRVLAKIF